MTPKITQPTAKHATADRRTNAHLTETASNHQSSTKQPSNVPTITMTSRQDTEITLHHSATQNTRIQQTYLDS